MTRHTVHTFRALGVALTLASVTSACGRSSGTSIDNTPVPAEALAAFDTATVMQHIRVLSADSLMGRGPGTAGEEKSVVYLESQFKAMGLEPGNPDGSYIQKVPLVGITVKNSPTLTFTKGVVNLPPHSLTIVKVPLE